MSAVNSTPQYNNTYTNSGKTEPSSSNQPSRLPPTTAPSATTDNMSMTAMLNLLMSLLSQLQTAEPEKGDKGDTGTKGDKGDAGSAGVKGDKGNTGATGSSAYQVWLSAGNTGSQADFLNAIKGDKGDTGTKGDAGSAGVKGDKGNTGAMGSSAYQVWLSAGNTGSQADFLNAIKGDKGDTGSTGIKGDKGDKGDVGQTGAQGSAGAAGSMGMSAYQIWLGEGNTGSKEDFLSSLRGTGGAIGLSAYEIWLGQGNKGSKADFLITLKGNAGATGATGTQGVQGVKGDKGDAGAQGVAGQGFFNWFAVEVGDVDGDNDIDKQDVRLWFAGAAPAGPNTTPTTPTTPAAPVLVDLGDSFVTGEENKALPLNLSHFKFNPDAQDGITITVLPQDGQIQAYTEQGWQALPENVNISLEAINNGVLRFIPDANETGINGNPAGVGNGKADYAQLAYVGTSNGQVSTQPSILHVDIKPVEAAPTTPTQPSNNFTSQDTQVTGLENQALPLALTDFHIDPSIHDGIMFGSLPKDGMLQVHTDNGWVALPEGMTVSLNHINMGVVRFVPDVNETGIDGNPQGVGNGKSDYAQFSYAGTKAGQVVSAPSTMHVDIKPVQTAQPTQPVTPAQPAAPAQQPAAPVLPQQVDSFAVGEVNTVLPLTLANFTFDPAKQNGIKITSLPTDGSLQVHTNNGWVAAPIGMDITLEQVNQGVLRFVPNANESGIDGMPSGVGNGKADYAQFQYAGTVNGEISTQPSTVHIDVRPGPAISNRITGMENNPVPVSLADFNVNPANADAIQLQNLPADGQLQIFFNDQWVPIPVGANVPLNYINGGAVRFLPDQNEFGVDGMAPGVGNGRADYAHIQFIATRGGQPVSNVSTLIVDIRPVATLVGVENEPLSIMPMALGIAPGTEFIQVTQLPQDGKLVGYIEGEGWVPITTDAVIPVGMIQAGFFRFIPDEDELGMDGYELGVGDGKSDYAHFSFATFVNGQMSSNNNLVAIDIIPKPEEPKHTKPHGGGCCGR